MGGGMLSIIPSIPGGGPRQRPSIGCPVGRNGCLIQEERGEHSVSHIQKEKGLHKNLHLLEHEGIWQRSTCHKKRLKVKVALKKEGKKQGCDFNRREMRAGEGCWGPWEGTYLAGNQSRTPSKRAKTKRGELSSILSRKGRHMQPLSRLEGNRQLCKEGAKVKGLKIVSTTLWKEGEAKNCPLLVIH